MMESFHKLTPIVWKYLLVLQISILNRIWICFSGNLSTGIIPSYLDKESAELYGRSLGIAEHLNILLQKIYRLRIHNPLGFTIHFPTN
jgi:hypothetical protein